MGGGPCDAKVAREEWLHRLEARFDEGVTRSSVEWIVSALACVTGDRGVRSPGEKPKPFSFHPGMVGEGKTGRKYSEVPWRACRGAA